MTDAILDLIDLDQKKVGYREFLSCWVYRRDNLTFLVDPGPTSTISHLVDTLGELEVEKVDYILLTHIHLDHGGGVSELLKTFPDARVFCHDIGVRHIVDPSKLWKGSVQVLGETAKMYGEPGPIPAENMVDAEQLKAYGIQVIDTPGHAPHHVSFLVGDILFAGEAIGTRVELASGRPYLRPATPPKFILDGALASLDKLLALDPEPELVAFAHYGLTRDTFTWCRRARKQLVVWNETLRGLLKESEDNPEERFFSRLQEIDPLYGRGRFQELPADIAARERDFLANTMDGMRGYIKSSEGRL
ncbi:MAG: MBL fold metallo-hydrolase [Deltaproteobacteria bacterium]|nr:MBL fold metallo-hydrolase [Deltaproteobacteria bacterium]